MIPRYLRRAVKSLLHELKEKNLSLHASGITFFLFLSTIPILLLVTAFLPLTPLTKNDLIRFLLAVIPKETQTLALALVDQVYKSFTKILPIALVTTAFSAGKGMLALMKAFNTLYGLEERRGYIRLRIAASVNTVLLLGAILLSLCLGVFGERLHVFLLTAILLFLYTFIPEQKQKISRQLPGALFAALGWNLCSWGFSWYIRSFSGLTAYGSLGTVTVFLLWLYFFSYILLLGAVVNIIWKKLVIFIKI